MLLAQAGGTLDWAYQSGMFFFGPLWIAVTVWIVIGSSFNYLRKVRERQLAAEIVQAMLANPKNSAEDIERVLTAWWGGKRSKAARAAVRSCAPAELSSYSSAKPSV